MTISLPNKANLTDAQLKEVYRKMWLIRLFEEKVDFFFAKGMIHGTTHLCVGEEATAAGSDPSSCLITTAFVRSPHISNWSIAAARKVSAAASMTFLPCSR